MAGIYLPDIGKLGIRIATGLRDKKKVSPSNMAENARFQAFSMRLETEKHERNRVLKKEERRMKTRKRKIDRRRDDIQRNRTQHANSNLKSYISQEKRTPVMTGPNDTISVEFVGSQLKSNEENFSGNLTTAIFPIQDDFRLLGAKYRTSTKQKILLPPLEVVGASEGNIKEKQGKGRHNKKANKKSISKERTENSVYEEESLTKTRRTLQSPLKTSEEIVTNVTTRTGDGDETSQQLRKDIKIDFDLTLENSELLLDNAETQTENDLENDSSMLTKNTFNHLLVEDNRRKALHQSLVDAFRAIKTCRYIRTPSRKDGENDEMLF